jgi:NTE family protein
MRIILNPILRYSRWRFIARMGVLAIAASLISACATRPEQKGNAPVVPSLPEVSASVTKTPPKLGLALGGGAARGFAHVGVIQVLEEAGLRPELLAGTSAGSLVAALYASGMSGAELQRVAESMEEAALTDWTLPLLSRGVFRGEALARYVNAQLKNRLMEQLVLPLGIVATDLHSGEAVLFQRGDVGMAVRASSAVPAVFLPVMVSGREFVDGGLVAPVPVRFARQMGAELVVAVDISTPPEGNPATDTFKVLLQTFAIMGRTINNYELKTADLVVRPSLVGVGSADFGSRRRAIEAGRAALLAMLPRLRDLMKAHRAG